MTSLHGLCRDQLLKWWWSSSCIFDLRVTSEIILSYGTFYLIPVWIPRWSTRLHNSQTTNRRPCCNNLRVIYINHAVAAVLRAQPFDYVVYLMFLLLPVDLCNCSFVAVCGAIYNIHIYGTTSPFQLWWYLVIPPSALGVPSSIAFIVIVLWTVLKWIVLDIGMFS